MTKTDLLMMKKKKKFTVEYPIRCSPSILFEFLSTPSGLQEWFAEKVDQRDTTFTFTWEKSSDEAECVEMVENEWVRYHWEDSEDDEYFEFRISQSQVTNETILQVTDFAADYELKDQQLLWHAQIDDLKHRIGG